VIFFTTTANAQRIHFTDSLNSWSTRGYDLDGFLTEGYDWYVNDTLIGANMYRVMEDSFNDYCCYPTNTVINYYVIREDTTAGLVYVLYNDTDRILYDFRLSVGDTFFFSFLPIPNYAYYDTVAYMRTVSIGSYSYNAWDDIQIDTFRHAWAYYPERQETIVDGIGSIFGPLFPIDTFPDSLRFVTLSCFHQIDTISFSFRAWGLASEDITYINCDSNLKTVSLNQSPTFTFFPNPVSSKCNIDLHRTLPLCSITILGLDGKTVYYQFLENANNIELNNVFPYPGFYYCQIRDIASGTVETVKILYSP